MKNSLVEIIQHFYSCPYSCGNTLDTLQFYDGTKLPTQEEIELLDEQLTEYKRVTKYKIDRAECYPDIPEQLDMIYKDIKAGTQEWVKLIDDIKQRYPKGE